jgi:hypothetical protein
MLNAQGFGFLSGIGHCALGIEYDPGLPEIPAFP